MPLTITRTVDAATEPLTTDEAKAHLRVDSTADDTLIDSLIVAARRHVEEYCRIALITQTWTLRLDGFPGARWWPARGDPNAAVIKVPRPPLISVASIAYTDENGDAQTWAADQYQVDASSTPGRISPAYSVVYPSTRADTLNVVTITYTAGYGAASAVPQPIKQAMHLLIGHWYENREASAVGVSVADLPMAVPALLGMYCTGEVY